jgi:hypothetical protein
MSLWKGAFGFVRLADDPHLPDDPKLGRPAIVVKVSAKHVICITGSHAREEPCVAAQPKYRTVMGLSGGTTFFSATRQYIVPVHEFRLGERCKKAPLAFVIEIDEMLLEYGQTGGTQLTLPEE